MNEIKKQINIEDMIYEVRGKQVMLDSDVAMLYQVATKRVNEVVKRNIKRFPNSFCFRITSKELTFLRSQIATSRFQETWGGNMYLPYVFTEYGIMMLSGLLFMAYILKVISSIKSLSGMFLINKGIVVLAIIFVYLFNLIIGLISVFNVLKKDQL